MNNLFGRKKQQDNETEEMWFGDAPQPENQPSDPGDDGVYGMTSPKHGSVSRKDRLIKGSIFIVGILFISIIVFVLMMSDVSLFSGKPETVTHSKVSISDEELMKEREERKKLEEQVKLLQKENGQIDVTIDRKLQQALSGLKPTDITPLERRIEEMARAHAEEQKALMATIESLKNEAQTPEEREELVTGSSTALVIYSTVGEWSDGRAKTLANALPETGDKRYSKGAAIMEGAIVNGKLINKLISLSENGNFIAMVESTAPYEVTPGNYLPAGTRFLGRVVPDWESRRLRVEIEKMQVGTNQLDVSCALLDSHGNPGLVTKYVDPMHQAMWSSVIPNLLSAAGRAAQDYTSYYDYTGTYREEPQISGKNIALEAAAEVFDDQSDALLSIAARKKPTIIVKEGIDVKIQFLERISLGLLMEAGVITQRSDNQL